MPINILALIQNTSQSAMIGIWINAAILIGIDWHWARIQGINAIRTAEKDDEILHMKMCPDNLIIEGIDSLILKESVFGFFALYAFLLPPG